jgi:hypothetical protein
LQAAQEAYDASQAKLLKLQESIADVTASIDGLAGAPATKAKRALLKRLNTKLPERFREQETAKVSLALFCIRLALSTLN